MKSFSLLYIEDDKDIQSIYIDCIKEYVSSIYLAHDGEEGYEAYLRYKPDIILLDINMPKLDGLSLAKKIRQYDRKVKIIITTSYGQQENLLQAIELYLIRYILKPIDFKELKSSLEKAIQEIAETKGDGSPQETIFYLNQETVWYKESKKLYANNSEIKLTKNERRLLTLFATNEHKVFTFFEIFDYISHDNFDKR